MMGDSPHGRLSSLPPPGSRGGTLGPPPGLGHLRQPLEPHRLLGLAGSTWGRISAGPGQIPGRSDWRPACNPSAGTWKSCHICLSPAWCRRCAAGSLEPSCPPGEREEASGREEKGKQRPQRTSPKFPHLFPPPCLCTHSANSYRSFQALLRTLSFLTLC